MELTFADSSHMMTNVCSIIRQEAMKCGVDIKLDPLTYGVCSRKVFEKGTRPLCGRGLWTRRSHVFMRRSPRNWRMTAGEIP